MMKSVLLVAFCLVVVCAEPARHLQTKQSSLSTCDVQSIKDLVIQVVYLTAETVNTVVTNAANIVFDLAYCLWPLDLYMCLEGDMEYDIIGSFQLIGETLVDYAKTLPSLLQEINADVQACASA